jgi:hypothetical protein
MGNTGFRCFVLDDVSFEEYYLLQKGIFFRKKGEYMTEQEQHERLAAGFAKLDNERRNFLDDYTQALVKTCGSGEKTDVTHTPGDEKPAKK